MKSNVRIRRGRFLLTPCGQRVVNVSVGAVKGHPATSLPGYWAAPHSAVRSAGDATGDAAWAETVVVKGLPPELVRWHHPGGLGLDAGCGWGVFTRPLERRFSLRRCVRLDFAPECGPEVLGDCSALPFGTGTFSLYWSGGVLGFVPDFRALVAEASRVLAPGGLAIFYYEHLTPLRFAYAAASAIDGEVGPEVGDAGILYYVHAPSELIEVGRACGLDHAGSYEHLDGLREEMPMFGLVHSSVINLITCFIKVG